MSREDTIGILGTVLSSVLATLGFLWSIGLLQLLFSFLAGAFTTYVVQHRLLIESEKRKMKREHAIVMRRNIYGPIFEGLSEILEGVKSVQYLDRGMLESLKGVMAHYLFFTIKQELRSRLSEILNRVEKYERIRRATEIVLQDVIRKEVEKVYHVDIGTNENTPVLGLLIGKIHVASITLMQNLLRSIKPRDFVRTETEKWGKNIRVEISIGGNKSNNLSDFETLYENTSHEVGGEPLYREEKKQRKVLIDEIEAFLEQIKVFVNVE